MRSGAALALAVLAAGACQKRPLDIATPEPAMDSVRVTAERGATVNAALLAVSNEGMPLRLYDRDAGLVETDYADLAAFLPQYNDLQAPDRFVRFRLLTRELNGETAVIVQALHNPWYPTAVPRYYERAVPKGHPAHLLADRLLAHVEVALGPAAGQKE